MSTNIDSLDFLAGGGEMGAILRSHDWSATTLGHPATWPQSLRTAVRIMLQTGHPIFIFWGESGTCFYNDAYRQSIGPERHPSAIGRPAYEVWAEIWDIIGPQIAQVMAGKGATWHENHLVPTTRHGRYEDVYWTYSYGPIDDENSPTGVGGVLVICSETTQTVLVSRRYRFLSELGDLLRGVSSPQEIIEHTVGMLGEHLKVSSVGYAELDNSGEQVMVERDWTSNSGTSVVGIHRLESYGKAVIAELRAGHTTIVDDVNTSPLTAGEEARLSFARINTRAFIDVPIVKNGRLVGILFALCATPRAWVENEVVLLEEVAERIWSAVERSRVETALRLADQRKDEFLAMLAHELRNPLAPIGAAADLLHIARLDEARVRQTSEIISRQVKHMTSLIDDLLDVSRVTRGLIALTMTALDAKQIVSDAIEQVRPLIEARRHQLAVQLAAEPAFVRGEHKRLVQVLTNLLNNAAKYTPEGGNIALKLEVSDGSVNIIVTDDGIGMTPDLVARAFELFAQAERTVDRSQGGLGLGLALVKSLVELHNGSVTAVSKGIGEGAEFRIVLPRIARVDDASPVEHDDPSLPAAGGLKIMVVDDNSDAATMLAMFLEELGHTVVIEHDPEKALERARTDMPDVYLLDIGLPAIDGNELARRLRSQSKAKKLVLIAVTGYGGEMDRKNSALAGFDHHFIKPVDTTRLAQLLDRISKS